MEATTHTGQGAGAVAATISNAMVTLLHEYTGRGPTRARTTIGRDLVIVILGETLTKGERKLVEGGRSQHVLSLRREVQAMMRDDAVAAVETATGRKVLGFMSENHVEPDLAAEIFVLEPLPEDAGPAHTVEADAH